MKTSELKAGMRIGFIDGHKNWLIVGKVENAGKVRKVEGRDSRGCDVWFYSGSNAEHSLTDQHGIEVKEESHGGNV